MQLVPSILSNIRTASAGEHRVKFKQGEVEAEQSAQEILSQFSLFEKGVIARLIKLYRNLMGMREHHKFSVIIQLDIYKRAVLEEGHDLVKRGILKNEQDVFYFTLEQLIQLQENRFSANVEEFIESVKKTGLAVVVNEAWKTGSAAAEISSLITENCFSFLDSPVRRISAMDIPMPYNRELEQAALPHKKDIIDAVLKLLQVNEQ
jgi:hypothetical protein